MSRRFNTARIRRNYSFTVQDISQLFGIHKNTIREWLRQGLPKTDNQRPCLIYGNDLKIFLTARQKSRRKTCAPDEFYCLRCRVPRRSFGNLADIKFRNKKTFMLSGFCEQCETSLRKVQSIKTLSKILQIFDIPTQQKEQLIGCLFPSVNCDLEKEKKT